MFFWCVGISSLTSMLASNDNNKIINLDPGEAFVRCIPAVEELLFPL